MDLTGQLSKLLDLRGPSAEANLTGKRSNPKDALRLVLDLVSSGL
jgi:hypothetical protein